MAELEPLIEADGYLTIRAVRGYSSNIVGAKLVKVTQHKATTETDDIVVHLRVRVPLSKWDPPVVELDVPDDGSEDIEATDGVAEEEVQG